MKNKVKYTKNFKALYEELSEWMSGNDYNGSLEFAFRNGFDLHAVSLWEGSGASRLNKSAGISRKAELKEIEKLCALADVFICSHCSHHSFFWPGEIESDETSCESCGKTMKVDSRGKL